MHSDVQAVQEQVKQQSAFVDRILVETRKVVVGHDHLLERLLIGLLTGGHILVEGVPGLAKTLTVKTLCKALSTSFQRIQFTPDLLPADVIGTVIYNPQKAEFYSKKGPIFANLVLADEINRAPAKVQSALLEAMQEQQVTIGDATHRLPSPFMVMATQNPIEQEGTYPLPEAQIDRFMLHVRVGYPTEAEEKLIMDRMTALALGGDGFADDHVQPVATAQEILDARTLLGQIYVDEKVKDYMLQLVFATRDPGRVGLAPLRAMISHGASPRASIALNLAARAHALVRHRGYVTPEDVKVIGPDVLRHRVGRTYEAEAEGISSDDLIHRVFDAVEVP
jgi:MoxR-like ATPase